LALGNETPLTASFDSDEDVLYVSLGAPVPSFCDEDDFGILYRYAYRGEKPSGVTVIGFSQSWSTRRDILYKKIANFLDTDTCVVEKTILSEIKK
jgi:hypothetical protein